MKEINFKIEGMECTGCERRIQNAVSSISGVEEVKANHENGTVKVIATDSIDVEKIKDKISNLGFEVIQ